MSRPKQNAVDIVFTLVCMSVLFFQLFPLSFLLSLPLFSPPLFFLELFFIICSQVNKLILLLLPHLLLALVVFSHSLFHTLALSFSVFFPPHLLSSPLRPPLPSVSPQWKG